MPHSLARTTPLLCFTLGAALFIASPGNLLAAKGGRGDKGGGNGGGGGRLSPASLDVDTCGCPTTFAEPQCTEKTEWSIAKTPTADVADGVIGSFEGPLFEVVVTEGETRSYLSGSGQLIVSNSGGLSTYLSNLVVNLQDSYADVEGFGGSERGSRKCSDGRDNDRDGLIDDADPDCAGSIWFTLASALVNEQGTQCAGQANTCNGSFFNAANSSLILFDANRQEITSLLGDLEIEPDVDNDGDGQINEDPPYIEGVCFGIYDNDKDGLIDEDPGSIDNDGDGLIDEDCDDDDRDGSINEDPVDGIDNDGDGLIDEDGLLMDDDGDGAADEDCNGMYDIHTIEGDGIDNDGDGDVDEDGPDDDGDGLLDEDSGCDDTTIMWFEYRFDITGLGIEGPGDGVVPSVDDLRVELLATFKAGGERGGICAVDLNCDGDTNDEGEDTVRTVKQRHQFDPLDCGGNPCAVRVTDEGGFAIDDGCVTVTTDTLDEAIVPSGDAGHETPFQISGSVTCVGGDCDTVVTNVAELEFDTISRIQPALDELQGADGVRIRVWRTGLDAYFVTQVTGAGEFSGTYEGWCVDNGHFITPGREYCAELVSTYEDLSGLTIDQPEDMDLVNWIINQDYVGRWAGNGNGDYLMCDVQRAIWTIVDDQGPTGCGSYSQTRVNQIIAEAEASGDGFEPNCDERVSVALRIVDCSTFEPLLVQATVIDLPMGGVTGIPGVCDCDEGLVGEPAMASFAVNCNPFLPGTGITPGDFCSQTQGGWGTAACNGTNTACLRDQYFSSIFPDGLVVGDPDGPADQDGAFAFLLTSSSAVQQYIVNNRGGHEGPLTADSVDPEMTPLGTFGNQLVAAILNVGFDDVGVGKCTLRGDCDFRSPPGTLGNMIFQPSCVHEQLVGVSVNQVIDAAKAYAATGNMPSGTTLSPADLVEALELANQEFMDCTVVASGCLGLPG